jgi:hypothetical protein
MKKTLRRLPSSHRNTKLRLEINRPALRRLLLYAMCGVILAGGFSFAAWQHSAAVKYGYDMEKLRAERAHLEAERQRLQMARERVVSLPHLANAASAVGLQAMHGSQLEVAPKPQTKN